MIRQFGNRFRDLSGRKFGKLKVINRITKKGERVIWKCECECGNFIELPTSYLTSGDTQSCGCLREKQAEINLRDKFKEKYVEDVFVPNLTRKVNKNNTSGVKGVSWDKNKKKWIASLAIKGKTIYLGRYDRLEDAAKARKAGEEKYFKPYVVKLEEKENENS